MNKHESGAILDEVVNKYRSKSYSEIREYADAKRIETLEVKGASGVEYQIELQAFWDDKNKKTLRFMGAIDNGDPFWRRIFRSDITSSFIMAPDGSFVGE